MGVEKLLDLSRIDVLAAPDDHVLQAACDLAVILIVQGSEVSCVQPALFVNGLISSYGIVVVTAHDHVATGAYLAGLAPRNHLAGLWIYYLDLCVGQRPADSGNPS